MMKKALAVILAAGFAVGSYATDARVAVMGRQGSPYFYRDEVSVFINPADMSLYPNLIYGSFGLMDPDSKSENFSYQNTQPKDPLFGGMISYGFSDEENGPMLSIGAFVNRKDYLLERLIDAGDRGGRAGQLDNNLVDPLGKLDLMVGYDIGNGLALGLGFYTAYQCERVGDFARNKTALFKGTAGINYNIEQGLDLEASVNAGSTSAMWMEETQTANVETYRNIVSNGDYFLRGDVRFFSAVPAINGSFVPQVSLEYITLNSIRHNQIALPDGSTEMKQVNNEVNMTDLAGGIGINMNIDRGFFWTGLQGVYTQVTGSDGKDKQSIGARLSFGIERNIVWDWFLIRVGGQKELRLVTQGDDSKWYENPGQDRFTPTSDGSDNDLVGLGFGINIDNRLRVDFVASEDLPYTFTNLISGSSHHLFNRVSATYRF
jgi:hypothetical protein